MNIELSVFKDICTVKLPWDKIGMVISIESKVWNLSCHVGL